MLRTIRTLLVMFAILAGSRVYAQGLAMVGVGTDDPEGPAANLPSIGPFTTLPNVDQPATPPALTPVTSPSDGITVGWQSAQQPTFEDNNGPLLRNDPLLEGKMIGENQFIMGPLTPGWFASLEANVVKVHVKEDMYAFVGPYQAATPPVLGFNGFHLPFFDQGWNVSPVFQLGYRMDQAAGEFLFKYQFVNTTGNGSGVDASQVPSAISSHVNVNIFDVAYASREFSLGPWCDMKWFLGVRVGAVFFDTEASNPAVQQALNNNYVGAGPVFGLNLSKTFASTGVNLFCNGECALLYGPTTQFFDAGGGAMLDQQHNNLVIVPKIEAGAGWSPSMCPQLNFSAGYTFQYWSNLAEFQTFANPGNLPISRGDLTMQGGFVRAQWNY